MHRARGVWAGVALFLACAYTAAGLSSAEHGQNITINDGNDDAPLERCDQLDISFDRRPAVRDEEQVQVPAGREALRVHVSRHGGIAVHQGSGTQHEITLCKAVPAGEASELAAIRTVLKGSSVEVTGPDGTWVGYLIIRSPQGSRLDLSATNGPIRAEHIDGRLALSTMNGPISLRDVAGDVTARAQNGPIALRGGAGAVLLETQNGPIGVRLTGDQWQPGELTARAQNGPLSLSIPAGYRTGVEVESSGNAPWSCRGTRTCAEAWNEDWDDAHTRQARFGSGPTLVRLSTVNGPVSVRVGGR